MSAVANSPLPPPPRRTRFRGSHLAVHAILIGYTLVALVPVLLVISNSLKPAGDIFTSPWTLPTPHTHDFSGYHTVWTQSHFVQYFENSLFVTLASVFLVVLLSAMTAYALAEYSFMGNTFLALFFALGIMIPIRLGTVSILKLTKALGLLDGGGFPGGLFGDRWGPLVALVMVYTAMGIPLGVFMLSQFMRQVPKDLKNAARVDGAGEYRVFRIVLPLVRPGLAAVAVFTIIPVWNDLWFPLILAPGEKTKTVTLGAQQFLGQFTSDWNSVLAALTMAMLPILALYIVFSRQFLAGLTRGAID
jgi:raffinose/stachyose/melibiose transport system permease protein